VTLALRPGDAVALDYRLLHGTHANATATRRDCIVLNYAPSWEVLPAELKGHLIQHTALPGVDERPPAGHPALPLLPAYDGVRRDLALNRNAPARFHIS
jgi:hypothetical protein